MNEKWMIANVDGMACPLLDTVASRTDCMKNNWRLLLQDLTFADAWEHCVLINGPLPLHPGAKSKHDEFRTRFDGSGRRS